MWANFWAWLTIFCVGLSAYHYLGYPLILWIWAKFRPYKVVYRPFLPAVSLIIAAYNEAEVMSEKLENSLGLDYPPEKLEIWVVTDGSTDETPTIVQAYTGRGVRLLHEAARKGKSTAINRAARQATGDILIFSDANAFYEPDAIQKLVRNFADETVGGVSGKKTVRSSGAGVSESSGFYWRYESVVKKWESQTGATVAVVGEMMAVRRIWFEPIPPQMINDDAYLATRLLQRGARVLYESEAVCWETASGSVADETVRRSRINAGRYQLLFRSQDWLGMSPMWLWSLFSHKFLRLFLPLVMVAGFVGNGWAVRRKQGGWWLRWIWLGQLLGGCLSLVGLVGDRLGKRWRVPALFYYFLSSQFAVLQGLGRYLSGKQTVLWQKAKREQL